MKSNQTKEEALEGRVLNVNCLQYLNFINIKSMNIKSKKWDLLKLEVVESNLVWLLQTLDSELACSKLAAYTAFRAKGKNFPLRLMKTSDLDLKSHAGQKTGLFCPVVETYSGSKIYCEMAVKTSTRYLNINCSTSDNAALASLLETHINPSLNGQDSNAHIFSALVNLIKRLQVFMDR